MKRGKDEEKIMGPMFPRLHVNDTEKGGPRAPPRNKMALYEQLSIPSQRFSHVVIPPNNNAADLVPPSSQGSGNDRGVFFPRQVRPIYPSKNQYSQHSDLSTPLQQVVEQRNKLDEDDYIVPIFIHIESDNYSNIINGDKTSLSNPPYMHLHPSLKFQKAKEIDVSENSMKQTLSSVSHEPGNNLANTVDRLRNDDSGELELCAESRLSSNTAKRNSSNSQEDFPSENQNIVHDLSNDTGSGDDGSCRPLQTGNLERGDSVSETSILDAVSSPDITPDDIVGMIGQKHFWKARRAIVNQQRIFAVQVFELHRLIKVQKLISSSPHPTPEDSAFLDNPVVKPSPSKKRPLDYAVKTISNDPKKKGGSGNPSHKKEVSAENTVEKASFSSALNGVPPSSLNSPPPPSTEGSNHNARTTCFSHPQTQQWLIPVMSPTEGLVYKPYPGAGFVGQACGGCGPPVGNFSAPMYGIPAPPHQYPFSSFPPFGPHGYFSPYGVPIMATSAFSGSSVEQTNPLHVTSHYSTAEATSTVPTQKDGAVSNGLNSIAAEETEVQASTASCPSERHTSGRVSNERRNMLPLLPTSSAIDASNAAPQVPVAVQPRRVIKVVPHNSISASESAARIFRSIQEERKQYDTL